MMEVVDPIYTTANEGIVWTEPLSTLRAQLDGLLAVSIVLFVLSTIATALRLYTRHFILHSRGTDDWFIMLSQILFWSLCVTTISAVVCMIPHAPLLAAGGQENNTSVLRLFLAVTNLYDLTMVALKFSLGAFMLRIFTVNKVFKIVVYIVIAINTLLGLLNVGWTSAFPCQLWAQFFPGLPRCNDNVSGADQWFGLTIAYSIWTVLSDLLFTGLAIKSVFALQLPKRAKFCACALLLLGTMGGLASIVRVGIIIPKIPGTNTLGGSLISAMWSIIEPGLGITAMSLATLRPLLRKLTGEDSKPGASYTHSGLKGGTSGLGGISTVKTIKQSAASNTFELNEAGAFSTKIIGKHSASQEHLV